MKAVQAGAKAVPRDHGSKHHPRPRSRGGSMAGAPRARVLPGDEGSHRPKKHQAWHTLFAHRTITEALLAATVFWRSADGRVRMEFLPTNRMQLAWKELFGSFDVSPREMPALFLRLFEGDVIGREVCDQLAGRTPEDLADEIREFVARIFYECGLPSRDDDHLLYLRVPREYVVNWERIFDHFSTGEAIFYAMILWRGPEGSFNPLFFGTEMRRALREIFGTIEVSGEETLQWFRATFGDAAVVQSVATILGDRDLQIFAGEVQRTLKRILSRVGATIDRQD